MPADLPAPLLYLLQANAALLLFAGTYYGLLRRLTFYQLNRAYLLFALVCAAICPAVDFTAWLKPVQVPTVALPAQVVVWMKPALVPATHAPVFTLWDGVQLIYWGGVGLLALRRLVQLASLYRLHRRSEPATWQGQPYRRLSEAINPFSFGRAVYLNPDQHRPEDLPAILRHEQVHVRQWHTLDVLLAQAATALGWFNPAAWWLQRAVHQNLEFLTDQAVLCGGLDRRAYQYSLLHLHQLPAAPALANHFAFLTLKNRIAMMNRRASSRPHLLKYLLAAPLALALVAAFAATRAQVAASQPEATSSATAPAGSAAVASPAGTTAQTTVPVHYLDGVRVTAAEANQVLPRDVAEVNVLSDAAARQAFGEEGRDGVVVIVTVKNQQSEQVREFKRRHGIAAKIPGIWSMYLPSKC